MISVIKADGSKEKYDENKVRSSLLRAGSDESTVKEIIKHISTKLYEGIPTKDIYSQIYDELERNNHHLVSRYNLKKAIMALGPTGYPFEKFFAGVLEQYGYQTKTNVILSGTCVTHEVDILANKDGKRIMIEAKFHNRSGTKSDVRSTLYTHARFLDLQKRNNLDEHWLVTNTKATHDAVSYGKCIGMKVIAWDKPNDFSVRYLVESSHLHPITSLEYLSNQRKQELLRNGVVFVKDMKD